MTVLDIKEIMKIIPHRYPFLLIDRIVELEEGKRAVFPYLLTNNVVNVKKKLKDKGYTLLDPMEWYMDQLPKAETKDPK